MTERQAQAYLAKLGADARTDCVADGLDVSLDEIAFDIARACLSVDSKAQEACRTLGLADGYDSELYLAERI